MWLNGKPIYLNGSQVAEIMYAPNLGYTIRNLRPNGNIGVCFKSHDKADIRIWLDNNIPGWSQAVTT